MHLETLRNVAETICGKSQTHSLYNYMNNPRKTVMWNGVWGAPPCTAWWSSWKWFSGCERFKWEINTTVYLKLIFKRFTKITRSQGHGLVINVSVWLRTQIWVKWVIQIYRKSWHKSGFCAMPLPWGLGSVNLANAAIAGIAINVNTVLEFQTWLH